MNNLNKILNKLEGNVLPDNPEDSALIISNEKEQWLSTQTEKIQEKIEGVCNQILQDPSLTYEQQTLQLEAIYNNLSVQEQAILTKAAEFTNKRVTKLLFNYFKPLFPRNSDVLFLRVTWFMQEMTKLAGVESYTDRAFSQRDATVRDFDDFKWWDEIDAKIAKEYPDGVFTEQSFAKLQDDYDRFVAEKIREHILANPEKYPIVVDKVAK
jgi:hypothetical protein